MAGIDSPDGVCPVGARTGRWSSRRSWSPPRPDVADTPISDPIRPTC